MDRITAAFLSALQQPAWPELPAALAAVLARAHAAWPTLDVGDERFVRHLAERLQPPAADALETVQAEDLYLACACRHRVPNALELFDTHVLPRIDAVVRRYDSSDAFVDDVRQSLRQKLFLEPPRIAQYSGQGPLVAWLRAAAARAAVNALRPQARASLSEAEELDVLALSGPDPDLAILRGKHQAEFRAAFQKAVAALPTRERTALKLNALDGLSLEKIGTMYGVDKSSVSRWLTKVHRELVDRTRDELKVQLGLPSGDVESLMLALQSVLASGIAQLLASEK